MARLVISPDEMNELRTSPRYQCTVRVVGAGAAPTWIRGQIQDLSPSGLCLATAVRMRRGQSVHLAFNLGTGSVDVVGEIRWVTRRHDGLSDVGVRFIRISAPAGKALVDAARAHERAARTASSAEAREFVFR